MKKSSGKETITVENQVSVGKEWGGVPILPISIQQLKQFGEIKYQELLGLSPNTYKTDRGLFELLDPQSINYARLPECGGVPALEVFRSQRNRSSWLDLGCGTGNFIRQVLEDQSMPALRAVGFDARKWSRQKPPNLVIGDINKLHKSLFPRNVRGFDLITSAAVFYHLYDYWGVLGRSINLLKKNGKLIVSTVPRPIDSAYQPIDDKDGSFTHVNDNENPIRYYRNKNIFDFSGKLLSIAEVVQIFNAANKGFKLEYHSVPVHEAKTTGDLNFGGGFSGTRLQTKKVDMSFIFYAFYKNPEFLDLDFNMTDISFIVARSKSEKQKLKKQGFSSVQEMISS